MQWKVPRKSNFDTGQTRDIFILKSNYPIILDQFILTVWFYCRLKSAKEYWDPVGVGLPFFFFFLNYFWFCPKGRFASNFAASNFGSIIPNDMFLVNAKETCGKLVSDKHPEPCVCVHDITIAACIYMLIKRESTWLKQIFGGDIPFPNPLFFLSFFFFNFIYLFFIFSFALVRRDHLQYLRTENCFFPSVLEGNFFFHLITSFGVSFLSPLSTREYKK